MKKICLFPLLLLLACGKPSLSENDLEQPLLKTNLEEYAGEYKLYNIQSKYYVYSNEYQYATNPYTQGTGWCWARGRGTYAAGFHSDSLNYKVDTYKEDGSLDTIHISNQLMWLLDTPFAIYPLWNIQITDIEDSPSTRDNKKGYVKLTYVDIHGDTHTFSNPEKINFTQENNKEVDFGAAYNGEKPLYLNGDVDETNYIVLLGRIADKTVLFQEDSWTYLVLDPRILGIDKDAQQYLSLRENGTFSLSLVGNVSHHGVWGVTNDGLWLHYAETDEIVNFNNFKRDSSTQVTLTVDTELCGMPGENYPEPLRRECLSDVERKFKAREGTLDRATIRISYQYSTDPNYGEWDHYGE